MSTACMSDQVTVFPRLPHPGVAWVPMSSHPKRHHGRFIRFAELTIVINRHTGRESTLLCRTRLHARAMHAMPPNSNVDLPVPICEQFRVCNSRASCDVFAAGESNQDAGNGGRRFHVLVAASVRRSSSPLLRTSCPAVQPGVLASCSSQSFSRVCTARITQSAIAEHISLHKGGFKRRRRGPCPQNLVHNKFRWGAYSDPTDPRAGREEVSYPVPKNPILSIDHLGLWLRSFGPHP